MADAFRTIVIPELRRTLGRQLAAAFDKVGPQMFETQLSATGLAPVTHRISSGFIPRGIANVLPLKTWTWNGNAWVSVIVQTGDAAAIQQRAIEMGLSPTLTQVQNVLDAMDVSDQPPFDAIGRMGLKII